MQKIIVTGGLGFIGSNMIKYLLSKKLFVINIDKISYASNFYNVREFKNHKNYKFIKCDIRNYKKLISIIYNHNPICIFNLAAETIFIAEVICIVDFTDVILDFISFKLGIFLILWG